MSTRKKNPVLLGSVAVTALFTGAAWADTEMPCDGCHKETTPAIYEQWTRSRHQAARVGCADCHATERPAEQGSFLHHGRRISVIVSPQVCGECHAQEYREFGQSAHARAHECVSTAPCRLESGKTVVSCGQLFIDDYEGNVAYHSKLKPFGLTADAGALATGINGCWQCHGSRVKLLPDGRPDPATWPNAGIGRVNPDGSKGNCAACHQRHAFSAAEARRPELCGVCHNEAGGEPQLEIYNLSRHGTTYRHNSDKMNLDAPKWVAGEDYSAAPTCATCHMSAARGMPVTHNVDERILNRFAGMTKALFEKLEVARELTCRCGPDFCTHCQIADPEWVSDYCQINRYPGDEPRQYMSGVCRSCHSGLLVGNYQRQYFEEVDLVMTKWIEPGRRLYTLASRLLQALEGDQYAPLTNTVAGAWLAICNHDAKYALYGAAMLSPGFTVESNGALAGDWSSSFVPALAGLIDANICSRKPTVKKAAEELRREFCSVLSNPTYGGAWRRAEHRGRPDPEYCYNYVAREPCQEQRPPATTRKEKVP